jgi:hypothetical protein
METLKDRTFCTERRMPEANSRGAGNGAFLAVVLLILILACWLDRAVGPTRPSRMWSLDPIHRAPDTGSRPSISIGRTPNAEDPGPTPDLHSVIVDRLIRQPAPAGCAPSPFYELVEPYARLHGLDGRLVAALIEAESGFDPEALSEKGAVGLMQLLPSTAADLGVTDPWDPVQNVAAGIRYLKVLLDRYGGNVGKALAAYNTGLDRVDRSEAGAWPAETRQFVQRVLRAYDRFHKACPSTVGQ